MPGFPYVTFWKKTNLIVYLSISLRPNPNQFIMKKALIVLALLVACIGAKAQTNQEPQTADTLTYQQLMADYVKLNHQIADFRKFEITSIGLGVGACGLGVVGALMSGSQPRTGKALLVVGGVVGIASLATCIIGYDKLKHDRLEVTPDGVIIKIGGKK